MLAFIVSAQKKEKCATHIDLEKIQEYNPELYESILRVEEHTIRIKDALENPHYDGERIKNAGSTIFVPVVVHILHGGEKVGKGLNISDAQVNSQIDVLNEDYQRMNPDASMTPAEFIPSAGRPNIKFKLACIDPHGNQTNGITRHEVENTKFFVVEDKSKQTDEVATGIKFASTGGANGWPSSRYLNIWVCDLGDDVLGYSSALTLTSSSSNSSIDGVVITTTSFGIIGNVSAPYDGGRTATHEIGHWLNLFHVSGNGGCGDDFCADTPTQETQNFSCPSFPSITCDNAPNGDMFMNFMDYTDDNCMNIFTNDQITRMRATFLGGGPRSVILDNILAFKEPPSFWHNCTPVTINLTNLICEDIIWQVTGPVQQTNSNNKSITLLPNGTGTVTVTAMSGSYVVSHTFNVVSQALITGTYGTLGNNFTLNSLNSVQKNQNYTVNVQYAGATAFIWKLESGSANFATNNSGSQLDFNLGNSSSATFKVVTLGTCGLSSRTITFIAGGHWVTTTSPNPTDTDALVKLYKVDMDSDADYPAFDVRIFNKFNQLMKETHVEQGIGELRLDVADFPTDVYTVQIETEGEVTTTQLVKID